MIWLHSFALLFVISSNAVALEPAREIVEPTGTCGRLQSVADLVKVIGGKKYCLADGTLLLIKPTIKYGEEDLPIEYYRGSGGWSSTGLCALFGLSVIDSSGEALSGMALKLNRNGQIDGLTSFSPKLTQLLCR